MSPGVIDDFHEILRNVSYSLPLYPTSLLLATDIELAVDVPFIFHTLPTLIKLSYDPDITGGFGPFSFGPLHRASVRDLKFRVDIRDNKISINIPGTQLIGFVSDVVPRHPRETVSRYRRSTLYKKGESQFDEWLLLKRNKPSSDVFSKNEDISQSSSSDRHEDDEERAQHLKLVIAPTHPSNTLDSRNMGISAEYSFSANSSTRQFTDSWP